jgi:hypothetical protein
MSFIEKRKHKELATICCNSPEDTASFDDVEKWLNENQDEHGLLKRAANTEMKTAPPLLREIVDPFIICCIHILLRDYLREF